MAKHGEVEEMVERWYRVIDAINAGVEVDGVAVDIEKVKERYEQQVEKLWAPAPRNTMPVRPPKGRRSVRRVYVDDACIRDIKQKYGLGKKEVE